jgi:hypothetical protein
MISRITLKTGKKKSRTWRDIKSVQILMLWLWLIWFNWSLTRVGLLRRFFFFLHSPFDIKNYIRLCRIVCSNRNRFIYWTRFAMCINRNINV